MKMSAALVRQALEFVDPDESSGKGKNRGASRGDRLQGASAQGRKPLKQTLKTLDQVTAAKKRTKRAVKQLLELSSATSTVGSNIANKIVERAVKGKALADKIEVNNEPQKSILFSEDEDEFDKFEEELFCS